MRLHHTCGSIDSTGLTDHPLGVALWSYAEGNSTVLAIVVLVIAMTALAYVARRLWRK
jgi:hypothetical protein